MRVLDGNRNGTGSVSDLNIGHSVMRFIDQCSGR